MMARRGLAQRLRDGLLAIPALMIVLGSAVALVATALDERSEPGSAPLVLTSTIEGTRTILGTLAGATITVAAVVFSIMAVTVQLSANQYSPRVTQGFLRDRFQQLVVGVVVGTFTYSLVALGTLRPPNGAEEGGTAGWTALIGISLGTLTAVAIVAFVDHINRRVRIDDTVRRLAGETADGLRKRAEAEPAGGPSTEPWALAPNTSRQDVRTNHAGWVVGIDPAALATQLPDGAVARIEPPVGAYVNVGDPVVAVWTADSVTEGAATVRVDVERAVSVDRYRTIDQDPTFGIRQLVDIALRALSPGVNDPTTASDVVRQLVGPLRMALAAPPRPSVFRGERGVRVYRPAESSPADLVRQAYSEIRLSAGRHPTVYAALLGSLYSLRSSTAANGRPGDLTAIDHEIERTRQDADEAGLSITELTRAEGWGSNPAPS